MKTQSGMNGSSGIVEGVAKFKPFFDPTKSDRQMREIYQLRKDLGLSNPGFAEFDLYSDYARRLMCAVTSMSAVELLQRLMSAGCELSMAIDVIDEFAQGNQ